MIALLHFCIVTIGTYTIGSLLLPQRFKDTLTQTNQFLISISISTSLIMVLYSFLGILGWIKPLVAYGLEAFLIISFIYSFSKISVQLRRLFNELLSYWLSFGRAERALCYVALLICLMMFFSNALTPYYRGDALAGYIALPKIYAKTGQIGFPPNIYGTFPQYIMAYYTWLYQLHPLLPKIIHYSFGIYCLFGVWEFVLGLFGSRAALFGTLALLFNPLWLTMLSDHHQDLMYIFYIIMSFSSFACWQKNKGWIWFILAIQSMGIAIGSKYFGLFHFTALMLLFLYPIIRGEKIQLWNMIQFASGSLFVGSFWYIRNWIVLKNPLWPFLSTLFDSPFYNSAVLAVLGNRAHYLEVAIVGFAKVYIVPIWQLTLNCERYELSLSGFSPIFLTFLAFLPFFWKKLAHKEFFIYIASYYILWASISLLQGRYLLPPLIMMCVYVGFLNAHLLQKSQFYRLTILTSWFVIGLFCAGIATLYAADGFYYRFQNKEGKQAWLTKKTFYMDVINWANSLPKNAKVLTNQWHGFYFDIDIEQPLHITQLPITNEMSPKELCAELTRNQITHIISIPAEGGTDISDRLLSGNKLTKVYENNNLTNLNQFPMVERAESVKVEAYELQCGKK